MEDKREKQFQNYAPSEKRTDGYYLNGVFYTHAGERVDPKPPVKKTATGKKTAAILFTIFCFLVNFIVPGLGILLPVVACIVEIVYAKRKNIAEHKAKAITIGLCVILGVNVALVVFTGAFFQIISNKSNRSSIKPQAEKRISDKSETVGTFKDRHGKNVPYVDGFETFTLAGVTFTLPADVTEFESAGFTLKEGEIENGIAPGQMDGCGFFDPDGNYRGTLFIYNTTDQTIQPEDGVVGGLTVDPNEAGDDDLTIIGGIGFHSSMEELQKALGSEVTKYEKGKILKWYFADEGFGTSVSMELDADNTIDTVWIMNDAGLR